MEADGTMSLDIQGLDMGLEGLTSVVPALSVAFSKNYAANTRLTGCSESQTEIAQYMRGWETVGHQALHLRPRL